MASPITPRRYVLVALFMLATGVQLGLWLADYYDDGVHDPLSLAIGLAMLGVGIGVLGIPFVRR